MSARSARRARSLAPLALLLAACTSAPPPAETPAPVAVVADTPAVPAAPGGLTAPPVLAAPPALALPPIATRTLPNGLQVVVVEHRELPVADFALVVRTGAEADPADHAGLATLAASMLDEGTTTRSALEIADAVAWLGADLGTFGGFDESRVMLHVPTAQLDSALALFADVAVRPSFPQADFDRLKQERLTALLQLKDRGPAIADIAYANIVFGGEHPYGRAMMGTEATVARITRDDARRFHRTYFRPNNATLIVVGDVRTDDIVRRIERAFGGWERGAVPATRFPAAPKAAATTVYLIDKPGAAQSSFRIGGVGAARSTDDYFALLVMNTILGGSFTSRLNQTLREEKGYTYGAGSSFALRREPGPFTARAEIVSAKTDSALLEFMRELRGVLDTVPQDELSKAKRYLQLQLPGDFETTRDIAAQLAPLVLHGLPLDYYDGYVQRIDAVTQDDVRRVARRYIDPEGLAIVIVGDRATIEPGLRALGVGDISIRDLRGEPVRP
ncbi:MAG TPA: pitrilysin family protein [Gemmatimonadaceae bacterium]